MSKRVFSLQQSINNDPTCLESIVFSSTSGMTTNDNLPSHESTSKANLDPKIGTFQKVIIEPFEYLSANIQA